MDVCSHEGLHVLWISFEHGTNLTRQWPNYCLLVATWCYNLLYCLVVYIHMNYHVNPHQQTSVRGLAEVLTTARFQPDILPILRQEVLDKSGAQGCDAHNGILLHIGTHTHTVMCTYIYIHIIIIHICTYMYMYDIIYTSVHSINIYIWYMYIYMYIYISLSLSLCIYIYMHTHVYAYICTCVHAYIYIYVRIITWVKQASLDQGGWLKRFAISQIPIITQETDAALGSASWPNFWIWGYSRPWLCVTGVWFHVGCFSMYFIYITVYTVCSTSFNNDTCIHETICNMLV